MLEISIGCTNEETYGLSCHKCEECGRKFTVNGIDDGEVVERKVNQYTNFIKSDLWNDINTSLDKNILL